MTFTCVIAIAFNLFVFELNDSLNLECVIALIDLCAYPGLTFLYFYFSERITTDLEEIGGIFYSSTWYRLTTKHQKYLVLPIARAEREFRLTGLGMFYCSLPIFSSV